MSRISVGFGAFGVLSFVVAASFATAQSETQINSGYSAVASSICSPKVNAEATFTIADIATVKR